MEQPVVNRHMKNMPAGTLPALALFAVPRLSPAGGWQDAQNTLLIVLLCAFFAFVVLAGVGGVAAFLYFRRKQNQPPPTQGYPPQGYPAQSSPPPVRPQQNYAPPPQGYSPVQAPPVQSQQPVYQPPAYQPPATPPPAAYNPPSQPRIETPPVQPTATLTVLFSDDLSMARRVMELSGDRVAIGRSTQNDIVFPKDTPVSRLHAVIEQRGGQYWLQEVVSVDELGQPKRPRFGTFVNENQVGDQPVLLRSGDFIRLGPRVRLEFRAPQPSRKEGELTVDAMRPNLTMDAMAVPQVQAESKPAPVAAPQVEQPRPLMVEYTPPEQPAPPEEPAAPEEPQAAEPEQPVKPGQTAELVQPVEHAQPEVEAEAAPQVEPETPVEPEESPAVELPPPAELPAAAATLVDWQLPPAAEEPESPPAAEPPPTAPPAEPAAATIVDLQPLPAVEPQDSPVFEELPEPAQPQEPESSAAPISMTERTMADFPTPDQAALAASLAQTLEQISPVRAEKAPPETPASPASDATVVHPRQPLPPSKPEAPPAQSEPPSRDDATLIVRRDASSGDKPAGQNRPSSTDETIVG